MSRRHLFDNGYPVSGFTRYAGSQVLLLMAESSKRMVGSPVLSSVTRVELRESRDNFNHGNATARRPDPQLEAGAAHKPGELRRVEEPHQP